VLVPQPEGEEIPEWIIRDANRVAQNIGGVIIGDRRMECLPEQGSTKE